MHCSAEGIAGRRGAAPYQGDLWIVEAGAYGMLPYEKGRTVGDAGPYRGGFVHCSAEGIAGRRGAVPYEKKKGIGLIF